MATRKQTFATYHSPGLLFCEIQEQLLEDAPLEDQICRATALAKGIKERHGARPFAFDLRVKIVSDPVDDGFGGVMEVTPKLVSKSSLYHLGGRIVKVTDTEGILRGNMEANREPLAIETRNSYRHTSFFSKGDQIVNPDNGQVLQLDPSLETYREKMLQEWND